MFELKLNGLLPKAGQDLNLIRLYIVTIQTHENITKGKKERMKER